MRSTACALAMISSLALTALASSSVAATATPTPAKTTTTQTLAPGLTLTRISDPAGPWILRVLTIDPSKPLTIDVTTAGGVMGSWALPSAIGDARGALAAINGDFPVDPGRPLHPFAEDGVLKELGLQNGANFGISQDESAASIDTERRGANGKNLATKKGFSIEGWNTGAPEGGGIVAFTPYGGSAERPPSNACAVRLKPARKMAFGKGGVGVVRDYTVVRRRCLAAPMSMRPGTVVLSSRMSGAGAKAIKAMRKRGSIRLRWTFGWNGVMDSVGGMPMLVRDGKNVAHDCSSYFCSRNPRTGIGVTAEGDILLVTVDGRKSSSVGMSLIGFAGAMIDLGAVAAVNLDGGGGSTMWVKGQGIVNDPSDRSGERPVTNAVLVLPGVDPGEPILSMMARPLGLIEGGRSLPPTLSRIAARRVQAAAFEDPGSTGGLLEAFSDLAR
jgi:hypothetical protein